MSADKMGRTQSVTRNPLRAARYPLPVTSFPIRASRFVLSGFPRT